MMERLAICETCQQLQLPLWRCRVCGCLMQLKARVPGTKCPLGKW